jgi:cytochrome c-type biogenesis protein CcmE
VIALATAGLLAIFLLYTAVAGNSTPQLQPSNLAGHTGYVSLTGKVVGPISGDSHSDGGLRFRLRDIRGESRLVSVVFHGSKPDLFAKGRDVNVSGKLVSGTFTANALTTKCPSKYTAAKKS